MTKRAAAEMDFVEPLASLSALFIVVANRGHAMNGIADCRTARRRAGSFARSLKRGTALNGAIAALLLLGSGAAETAEECGAPLGGVVTCTPEGNPYDSGITYSTSENLILTVENGVVVAAQPGRVRVDGDGDADVTIDVAAGASIGASGFFRAGVEANAADGDIVINARGPIVTKGFLAYGIRAVSSTGAISITSGDIFSTGGNGISAGGSDKLVSINATGHIHSVEGIDLFLPGRNPVSGIFVSSDGEVQIANSGLVEVDAQPEFILGTTLAVAADGIHVRTQGDVTISGAGAIATSGLKSRGIAVKGGDIFIRQGSVATTGKEAAAVIAEGAGDIAIDVDRVSSARFQGLIARSSGGDIDVGFGSLDTQFIGVFAQSAIGAVQVTAGAASVGGESATAIHAVAGTTAGVTVNGAVNAARGFGVIVESGGPARVDIAAGASVTGGIDAVNITTAADAGATVNNFGAIIGGNGFALFVDGGPATIDNAGTISGRMGLTGGGDVVTNSGTFDAIGDSDFREGADTFYNDGTFKALSDDGAQGGVELFGLEYFENSGAIDLVDGRADGFVGLEGDYFGADGRLELDVRLRGGASTGADQLILSGVAAGRTLVVPRGLDGQNGLLDPGTAIVFAGPGSSADAFTTDGLNIGFVEYGVAFDNQNNIYRLVGGAGDAAYQAAKYAEGARNLWYESSDAWSAHMRETRDGRGEDAGGRLWTQIHGSANRHRESRDTSFAGVTADADLSYEQDYFGAQVGYDLMRAGGLSIGVTAGYITSDLDFRGPAGGANYDAVNAGIYAGFTNGLLFANLLAKYDHVWIDARDRSIGFGAEFDGNAYGLTSEVGLRFGPERLFLEPVATLSYVHTDLDDFSALSSRFDYDTADGLRGKLGARAGSTFETATGTQVSFYLGGNAVKEFGGRDGVAFHNNGLEVAIDNDRIGLYGEAVAGINVSSSGVGSFLEGFGKFGARDGLRGGGGRAGLRVMF